MRNPGPDGGSRGRARGGAFVSIAPGMHDSPAGTEAKGLAGVHVSHLDSPLLSEETPG